MSVQWFASKRVIEVNTKSIPLLKEYHLCVPNKFFCQQLNYWSLTQHRPCVLVINLHK